MGTPLFLVTISKTNPVNEGERAPDKSTNATIFIYSLKSVKRLYCVKTSNSLHPLLNPRSDGDQPGPPVHQGSRVARIHVQELLQLPEVAVQSEEECADFWMLCSSRQVAKPGELAASAKTGQSTLYDCLDLGKMRKKVKIVAASPCVLEPEFRLTSPNHLPGHASCLWQVGPWLCGSSQPLQTLLDRVQALAGQAEQTRGVKHFGLKR